MQRCSWTNKFPQSEMLSQEIKKQTELWICQLLLCICIWFFCFFVPSGIGSDILFRHNAIEPCKSSSTIVSKGGSNWQTAFNHRLTRDHKYLHKTCIIHDLTSSYNIIQTSKVLKCLCGRGSTIVFDHYRTPVRHPKGGLHSRTFQLEGIKNRDRDIDTNTYEKYIVRCNLQYRKLGIPC